MKQQRQNDFTYKETFKNYDRTAVRCRAQIDLNWEFMRGDMPDVMGKNVDELQWRLLNLPHDWSIEGEYDPANPSGGSGGYLPAGIGWYRKILRIPCEWRKNRRIRIAFDGVFCNSTVYVDGARVGGFPYGWLSFSCDITDQVQEKETVEILVKVDNSVQPAARWYTGSGIYSHVWIISTEKVHIAENGTYITTPAVERIPGGEVCMETTVENDSPVNREITVRSAVYRKSDDIQVAQVTSDPVMIPAGGSTTVKQSANVSNPLLWNTETPNLYYVETELLENTTVLDDYHTVFGFRAISYDHEKLYLNGENIKLRGVANHWAIGAMGAAQTTNFIRYSIQLMKDMGVNCIRTAHNARPTEFYELCDEMGMMVMDELFEGESGKVAGDYGTLFFKSRWKMDVESWIKRDRNHPSVIIWSIGNETGSNNDNTGISDYIKNFDTSRPTTGSFIYTGVDIPGSNGISEILDYQRPSQDLPMIATEAPHTHGVRGVYRTKTWFRGRAQGNNKFDIPDLTDTEIFKYDWQAYTSSARIYPSSYDNAVSNISVRKHWALTRDIDWRTGEFRWTGIDYLGEANYVLGGWPYRMFHSGAVDTALFEKDMYYLYQSMWSSKPMLHILPSWTHPTLAAGTKIPVWVYSNCEKVELFINGNSLGVIDRGPVNARSWDEIQFEWYVPYMEGSIKAVGYDAGGKAILEEECATASSPAGIALENITGELPVDAFWVGQVAIDTVDKNGNFYPYGENRVYCHVFGPAYLKAMDNGSPTDVECHNRNSRNAFMGRSKAFVQATQEEGDVLFTAASILGEKRQLTSDRVYIDVQQLALRGKPTKKFFTIYYTTDGTAPDESSARYTGPFSVSMGTTVKAAVYVEGCQTPMFLMEETFGENEGMYWAETEAAVEENVCTVSDAVLMGENIKKVEYGYSDFYAEFGGKPGSVEYTTQVEKAGDYYIALCYNNGSKDDSAGMGTARVVDVIVNGTFVEKRALCYNGEWKDFWSYHIVKVALQAGENKITLACPDVSGANLKELIVWPADYVLNVSEAVLSGEGEIIENPSAFDGQAIETRCGGEIKWKVTGKKAGRYKMRACYSTVIFSLKEIVVSINDAFAAAWPIVKSSQDCGAAWGLYEEEVTIAPGENTIKMQLPGGKILISAMILEPVRENYAESVVVDAACIENVRLGVCVASDAVSAVMGSDVQRKAVLTGEGSDARSDASVWDMVSTDSGAFYLVNNRCGKLLVSDGTAVGLADGEVAGNGLWTRMGEMEHFDYLIHVNSGKVLAVDDDGRLIVDEERNYNPGDRKHNRAFWCIRER